MSTSVPTLTIPRDAALRLGLRPLINKLRRLVRPLLDRVLR
jgi:hypothetical protein